MRPRTLVALHGEMNIRDGPEDFVHLTDFGFVLEIHGSVEVRNLGTSAPRSGNHHLVGRLAQKVTLRLVHDKSELYPLRKRKRPDPQRALEDLPQYLFFLRNGLHDHRDYLHDHL